MSPMNLLASLGASFLLDRSALENAIRLKSIMQPYLPAVAAAAAAELALLIPVGQRGDLGGQDESHAAGEAVPAPQPFWMMEQP